MAEHNKLAHLHAQESEHDEAYLIANTHALYEIMRAIGEALGTGKATIATLMTADGEEFELIVVRQDADWQSDVWQKALLPYTEGSGDGSGRGPWEHPAVRALSKPKSDQIEKGGVLMATPEPTQRVPCPGCGLPVPMPASWDGKDPDEALCNVCHEDE